MKLNRIDCSSINNHIELDESDICLYWCEYTARQGYDYSPTNQLILNLKKSVSLKAHEQYSYKIQAIKTCASYFQYMDWSPFSIIPIPPSKKRTDPLYDDRLIRVLNSANELLPLKFRFDIKDIVIQNESYEPSHHSSKRPSCQELKTRYQLEKININHFRNKIVIFDDVLTMGSHFKAVKSLLQDTYPDKKIYGLFIARSIYPSISDYFENLPEQY